MVLTLLVSGQAAEEALDYDRDIASIFRSSCAGCHNDVEMEGEFTLETYAGLREGGDKGDPIEPGDPSGSYLIRVLTGESKPLMPPKDEPQLAESDLARLKAWIAAGAEGPEEDQSLLNHLVVPELPPAEGKMAPITAVALTMVEQGDQGPLRALGRYGTIEVVHEDGTLVRRIDGLPGKVNALQFTPDGTGLLAASGVTGLKGVAQLWDWRAGRLEAEYGGHRDVLYDAEVSPDGQWVATAGYDSLVRLWRRSDAALVAEMTAHQGAVFDLAFHPQSQILATASADETVKLWRVPDGLRLDTLSQPQGEQWAVDFTADGDHVIAGGADKRLHLWRLVSRSEPKLNPLMHARFAHESAVVRLMQVGDGGKLVSAAADGSIKVWSLPNLQEDHAYAPLSDVATALVSLPRGDAFLVGSMDGAVVRREMPTDVEVKGADSVAIEDRAETLSDALAKNRESLSLEEQEPNGRASEAMAISWPAEIQGSISEPGDEDIFRFRAVAGQSLSLSINAARSQSKLDSKIEILSRQGEPLEQVVLQATRESWLTFRGKDSDTSDDFRVHLWDQMELNEYLYANGEVVKLWLYPRGPDSGFKVYPGAGKRHTSFFTTALTHPLGEPCYIVEPRSPGSRLVPNGLPVFPIFWENDDDPLRRWGVDSQLWFDVPEDGDYLVRVTDVRGFGADNDYAYTLSIRDRRPAFEIKVGGKDPKVSPGSGRELSFAVERHEGFDGEVRIDVAGLPDGFTSSSPIFIEAGQRSALGVLRAASGAEEPGEEADQAVRLTASATVDGKEVVRDLGSLGDIQLGESAKLTVAIRPLSESGVAAESDAEPLEYLIRPGETISARVLAERHDFEGRIELGGDDSGRNLPHGLYVDNIGLNGLLIVEGQSEREFFITAAPWVKPMRRSFHLRATADGGQVSAPAFIRVVDPSEKPSS